MNHYATARAELEAVIKRKEDDLARDVAQRKAELEDFIKGETDAIATDKAQLRKLNTIAAVIDGDARIGGGAAQPSAHTRAAKGDASAKVLELIRAAGSDGMTRAELIDRMGVKVQKAGESSASTALVQLKKVRSVVHMPEDGKYRVPVWLGRLARVAADGTDLYRERCRRRSPCPG